MSDAGVKAFVFVALALPVELVRAFDEAAEQGDLTRAELVEALIREEAARHASDMREAAEYLEEQRAMGSLFKPDGRPIE